MLISQVAFAEYVAEPTDKVTRYLTASPSRTAPR